MSDREPPPPAYSSEKSHSMIFVYCSFPAWWGAIVMPAVADLPVNVQPIESEEGTPALAGQHGLKHKFKNEWCCFRDRPFK